MSVASKVTFALCCAGSIATIIYVHYKQNYDRDQLHVGVIRDIERQQRRKIDNTFRLQQQAELTVQLRRIEEQKRSEINNT